jgi:two-component system, NtrC family, sensor kinase
MNIQKPASSQMEAKIPAEKFHDLPPESLDMGQSGAALQIALAASGLGWWNWNLLTNQTYFDPQWKEILGYQVEEITHHYQSFAKLVHPQDLLIVDQVLQKYLVGDITKFEIEFRMLAKSGDWKWIFSSGQVVHRDEFHNPVLMTGTHRDITQEKKIQETLAKQEQQKQLLKAVQKHISSSSIFHVLLTHVLTEIRQFLQVEQALIYHIQPNGRGKIISESVETPLASLKNTQIQVSIPEKDLQAYQLAIREEINPVAQLSGKIIFLNQCESKSNLVTPILLKNADCESYETSEQQLWGLLIIYDCSQERQWQTWEIEAVTEISQEIATVIEKHQLWEQIKSEIHKAKLLETQLQETSQQLQVTQGQLLHNDKMANLGQIVVEMANEIYHPVNFIYHNLHPTSQYAEDLIKLIELYQYYYPQPQPGITSYLQQFDLSLMKTDFLQLLWSMRAGSERMQDIVTALRNFSSLDDLGKIKKSDLHEGLESVLRILEYRLKAQEDRPAIAVIKDFGELPLIECYPGELNQVFMNILTNAIDALEERFKQDKSLNPQIWIRTEVITSHLSLVINNQGNTGEEKLPKKQKVVIRIYDNGQGILPHIKRRIFEPFFTTKPRGKAKGLGLAISQKIIVEKHQGKLRCNSQLGYGTELVIEMNTTARHYADVRKHASF